MSDPLSSSSAPADDFIHVTLDKSSVSSLTGSLSSSRSSFCQVIFHDLSEVYPTDGDISFTYSFVPSVIPQVGDRIALYKIGWSSVSEYVTYMYTNTLEKDDKYEPNKVYKITFSVESLPKDEVNMYQFCYITIGNVVAGSSIPFSFRKPLGNELVAVEDPNDKGLVVFRSRVAQLQEQLNQSNNDKEILEKTLDGIKSELNLAKSEMTEMLRKCDLHKESIHDMTVVIYDLNTEKKELLEKLEKYPSNINQIEDLQNINETLSSEVVNLKKLVDSHENDIKLKESVIADLKKEITTLQSSLDDVNKALSSSQVSSKTYSDSMEAQLEKANKTIAHFRSSIDGMQQEFEEKLKTLKEKFEADKQIYESKILNLNHQSNKENEKAKYEIASLKERLDESYNNAEQLNKTLIEKDTELKDLEERLSKNLKEVTDKQNAATLENFTLTKEIEKKNTTINTLQELVKSKDKNIAHLFSAPHDNNELTRKVLTLEDENALLLVQLVSIEEKLQSCENEIAGRNNEIVGLREEKKRMAEQLSKMNEEIRKFKTGQSEPTAGTSNQEKKTSGLMDFVNLLNIPTLIQQGASSFNNHETYEKHQSSQSAGSSCAKCNNLKEKIKQVMKEKIDIRSDLIQTKHSNEEYCKLLGELNEEAAALRSRIAVLEIELRKAKEVCITNQGEKKFNEMVDSLCHLKTDDLMSSRPGSSGITKNYEELYLKEKETKALLQRNVEALMIDDSKNFATIANLKKENSELSSELNGVKQRLVSFEEIKVALTDMDLSKQEMAKTLQTVNSDKARLEAQLIELRKQLVGKVSLNSMHELREENEQLKKQLVDKECCKKLREQLEASSVQRNDREPQPYSSSSDWSMPATESAQQEHRVSGAVCPICNMAFPPNHSETYQKHVQDHLD